MKMSPFQTIAVWKLKVKNGKIRNKYLADVELQMAEHKVQAWTDILYDWVQCGFCLSEELQIQLLNLDKQMTEIVLGAEQQCSKWGKGRHPWSPELAAVGQKVAFWSKRVSQYELHSEEWQNATTLDPTSASHMWLSKQECYKELIKYQKELPNFGTKHTQNGLTI